MTPATTMLAMFLLYALGGTIEFNDLQRTEAAQTAHQCSQQQ